MPRMVFCIDRQRELFYKILIETLFLRIIIQVLLTFRGNRGMIEARGLIKRGASGMPDGSRRIEVYSMRNF